MADVIIKIKRHATEEELRELKHAGIKGMRWGRRRFQNEDGSLTELGKKRYARATRDTINEDNKTTALVPKDQADKMLGKDANRHVDQMVKDDLTNTKTIATEGSKAANAASTAIRNTRVNVKRMDLSSLSDQEMRNRIQREQLESQYDQMFNAKRRRVEAGRDAVASIVSGLGTTLAVTGSALSIALAIKALRS